jgi:hypothetical protein
LVIILTALDVWLLNSSVGDKILSMISSEQVKIIFFVDIFLIDVLEKETTGKRKLWSYYLL